MLAEAVAAPGAARLTSTAFLIGDQSLVVGADDGSVAVWFRVERADAGTTDPGPERTRSRRRPRSPRSRRASVESSSPRAMRTAACSSATRRASACCAPRRRARGARLRRGALAARRRASSSGAVRAPRTGAFPPRIPRRRWARSSGRSGTRATRSPEYTWQSSSGTDLFEPKLSLVPLIFGTLKATFYSLLFARPDRACWRPSTPPSSSTRASAPREADDGDDGLAALRGAGLPRRAVCARAAGSRRAVPAQLAGRLRPCWLPAAFMACRRWARAGTRPA